MGTAQQKHCAGVLALLLVGAFVNGAICEIMVDPSKYGMPNVSVDPKDVSISGISAGAFAAVQVHVSFSQSFRGVGVIAGGPFYCAMGDVELALGRCMKDGQKINVGNLVDITESTFLSGFVDNPQYMRKDRMWVYSGLNDTVVDTEVVEKLEAYYRKFVESPDQVASVYNRPGEHGHPTLDYGPSCAVLESPFIYNCSYDASGKLLQHIHNNELIPPNKTELEGKIYSFNQAAFLDGGWSHVWGLDKTGKIYVPSQCENRAKGCKLHVALHGCQMSLNDIGDKYVEHAGYNQWGDANDMIILYPQAHSNDLNPYACFDWWGYTGTAYASNIGAQTLTIKRMVDVLEGNHPTGNNSANWNILQ